MNRNLHIVFWTHLLLWFFAALPAQSYSIDESPSGIENLHFLSSTQPESLVSKETRPLLTSSTQELFLQELEGIIPEWSQLRDPPNEELGGRLFAFNRKRDEARKGHDLLAQPIAFLWSGLLRQFNEEHQGFTVAIGPEFTPTAWGIVRFKPAGLPHEMIAIPSPQLRETLQQQIAHGERVEIKILFTGHLVPDESIIYAFSHEDPNQGMIIPVVQIKRVVYFGLGEGISNDSLID